MRSSTPSCANPVEQLRLRQRRVRVTDRGQDLVLGLRVEIHEFDLGARIDRRRTEQRVDERRRVGPGRLEVLAPSSAPVGQVDPAQKARDHLAQLVQHEVGVLPRLGQRVRPHPEQQRLETLAGAVDPHVRRRRRRQDAADRVERLGAGRRPVDELAVVRITLDHGAYVLGHQLRRTAVGVEDPVEVADVAGTERAGEHRRVAEVPVSPAEPGVVGDVAGALLEVAHQAAPLEDLRQQVRRLLTRQMHAAQLRHRVVAVVEEHALVQFLGTIEADRRIDRQVAGHVEISDELVEEQAPQRLGTAAVPSEQRALDDLRQIHQREHRPVEVREVPAKDVTLL